MLQRKTLYLLLIALGVFTGCAQHHSLRSPATIDHPFYGQKDVPGTHFQHQSVPEHIFAVSRECVNKDDFAAPLNFRADSPILLNTSALTLQNTNLQGGRNAVPLSPGDIIEVVIENGDGFNGRYVLDPNGFINIPLLLPIQAAGKAPYQVKRDIILELVRAEIFKPATALVSVQVLHWSGIEVTVSGAVFQPGRVLINAKHPNNVMDEQLAAYGDASVTRLLSEALRAASGVRPDAKLDQVILIRNGWQVEVDMTGILTGEQVLDYHLIAGDRVVVPSTGCFQSHLVRPSQITPKGFRVFMSNLIEPTQGNSPAAVGRYSTNIPYGTKLLQAAISANCIGGKVWTDAPRKVILASQHPITGVTQVIERSVEQLMRYPFRDEINPFLMPNDAVACYDSAVTNIRDVANTILDVLTPIKLL